MTQTYDVALSFASNTVALKVGTKEKHVEIATAFVLGGKTVQNMLADVGFKSAVKSASNGNYKAAVEIIGLALGAATIKAIAPQNGVWRKTDVMFLAQKAVDRTLPANSKGWSKNAMKGRSMARMILDMDAAPATPVGQVTPATPADRDNVAPDPLATVGEAPM